MSTFLKTLVAVGLLVFAGTAQADLVLNQFSDHADIGTPAVAGGVGTLGPTTLTINAGGSGFGVGATTDQGHFLFAEVVGNGSVSAWVRTFTSGTSLDRMAGVMIRQSLDGDSAYAGNFAQPDQPFPVEPRASSQSRSATGAATEATAGAPPALAGTGTFFKITRAEDLFTFAWRGSLLDPWTDFASATVPMFGPVFVGIAVTAGDDAPAAAAQGRFRNGAAATAEIDLVGFGNAIDLVWNNGGSAAWDSLNWDDGGGNPTALTPDNITNALLDGANTDIVTVGPGGGRALSLTVLGGDVVVSNGQTLDVDAIEFGPGTFLSMGNGTTLRVRGSGEIAQMVDVTGDDTINVGGLLEVTNFASHLFSAGTLTKQGAGTLQLDNAAGTVLAPNTTFIAEAGVIASSGGDPLGGADGVVLDGGDLSLANAGAINMATAITLNSNATITSNSTGASVGALTLADVTLTTAGSGGLSFAGTSIPGSAATIDTGNNTTVGALTAPGVEITKKGSASLVVLAGGDVTGATFKVEDGQLIGVSSSNPFDGAALVGAGGELVLANGSGSPATFDNALSLTSNTGLTGGMGDPGVGLAGQTVILGGVNGVDMNGNRLFVASTDGYTLNIAGAFTNSGDLRMEDGNVILSGGGGGTSMDARTVGSGMLTISTNLMTFDDLRTRSAGTINITGEVVVNDDLSIRDGGTVQTSAPLTADDVDVRDGSSLNTLALLTVTDKLEVFGGSVNLGALATAPEVRLTGGTVSATELVISDFMQQGDINYSISGGTFTASGSDMLNAVNLSFGGNTLTVSAPQPTTAADSSGNGHDGDVMGASFSSDVVATLAGGKSMDFNGGNNYVIVDTGGTQDVFDLGANITVAFWQKDWPDGSWEPMVSKRGEGGKGWQVRRRGGSSDNMAFTLRGTSDEDATAKDAWVKDDGWHHVVATYDGATRDIYIDGGLWDSDPVTGGVNASGAALVFGARNNSESDLGNIGNYSHVLLDDIYIYDRAITQPEIDALFANSGISTAGLVGNWTFDDPFPAPQAPGTNLSVTANAVLEVEAGMGTPTFGDLALANGVQLDLESDTPDAFSFGMVSGDGSIVGSFLARDGVGPGNSVGTLSIDGNLVLGDMSVYEWELTGVGSDMIAVTGDVTGELRHNTGWTFKVKTDQPLVPGEYIVLSYGGNLVLPLNPNYDLSEAPGWRAADLEMRVDNSGNVVLDVVPEPSTLALLLAAGLVGLLGYARRRRTA